MKIPGVLLALLAVVAACSRRRAFPPLEGITHAEVRTNLDSLGIIDDPARVAAIVGFVNARREGWEQPWTGVPVGRLGVTFYRGREVRGSFQVGTNFFESQREGGFFSRDATSQEVAQFRQLLAPFTEPVRR